MADVRLFKGIRYATAENLDDLVSPPYDVLSAMQAAELGARSPYNAVHLDLPVAPGEPMEPAAYARVAERLVQWRQQGILVRDPEPSLYLVDQSYRGPDGRERTRRGFVARIALAGINEGVVLPHEKTHAGPKADRLALYRATNADVSQIFLLYPDDEGRVAAALADAAKASVRESSTAHDGDGNVHRLTPVSGELAERVAALLADQTLYIADGHHRYETAVAYRDERRATGDSSADTMMVYLCAMNDPGLTVFPTHRLVKDASLPPMDETLARLRPTFEVVAESASGQAESGALLFRWLEDSAGQQHSFGLYFPSEARAVLVRLADRSALDRLADEGFSSVSAVLTVTVLHYLALRDALGVDPLHTEGRIDYDSDAHSALARLREGGYALGAFIQPTRVDDVRAIADGSETMPQKSTYFYPKLLTGLVFDVLGE